MLPPFSLQQHLPISNSAIARHSDQVVYRKQLVGKQTLLVSRHETTNTPPEQRLPPGFHYAKIDHTYEYNFVLSGPAHQLKMLWSHLFYSYAPRERLPTDFLVLDADVQRGTLVVVYKVFNKTYGGETSANIVSGLPKNELSRSGASLMHDSEVRGIFVSAAAITGSIAAKTLTVSLTSRLPPIVFQWKEDRWQCATDVAKT